MADIPLETLFKCSSDEICTACLIPQGWNMFQFRCSKAFLFFSTQFIQNINAIMHHQKTHKRKKKTFHPQNKGFCGLVWNTPLTEINFISLSRKSTFYLFICLFLILTCSTWVLIVCNWKFREIIVSGTTFKNFPIIFIDMISGKFPF